MYPKTLPLWAPQLSPAAMEFMMPDVMVKLLATIDAEGYPHVTLLTCNIPASPDTIKWGQFTQGTSKKNVLERPEQGLLYMNISMPFKFLQVKAHFKRISLEGEDAEHFNKMDLLRYNAYLNVEKVYFNEVVGARPVRSLGLFGVVKGIVSSLFRKGKFKTGEVDPRLPAFGQELFNAAIFPKFIAYVDPADGYPVIVPCFQIRSVERKTLLFTRSQFADDLEAIPPGVKVGAFALDFETRSLLVKGTYEGIRHKRGAINIEQVYNSMPPKAGMVYPELAVAKKVTSFHL